MHVDRNEQMNDIVNFDNQKCKNNDFYPKGNEEFHFQAIFKEKNLNF